MSEEPTQEPLFRPRFWSVLEMTEDLIARSSKEDRDTWRTIDESQLIEGHHGIGRNIRNDYRLWDPENPYTKLEDPDGELHPDAVSMDVMGRVWAFYHTRKG